MKEISKPEQQPVVEQQKTPADLRAELETRQRLADKLEKMSITFESPSLYEGKTLEVTLSNYFRDLQNRSDCPQTIRECPFESKDLKILTPEEISIRRDEFDDSKAELKKQWSDEHGQPWPKYEKDVYSSTGKLIRKAGGDYDAHHIQPLGMGGKNEASNITPLHANQHYDKQGIHSSDSPYSKLDKLMRGNL